MNNKPSTEQLESWKRQYAYAESEFQASCAELAVEIRDTLGWPEASRIWALSDGDRVVYDLVTSGGARICTLDPDFGAQLLRLGFSD